MDSLSGSKQISRVTALCLVLLCISLLFIGCPYTYPYESSARWVSDDPIFVVEYETPYDYQTNSRCAYLEVDGTRIDVLIYYQTSSYAVYPADPLTHERFQGADVLFRGTYKLKKDTMIFEVGTDNIWGGAYKEIRFTREELPTEMDIEDL